MSSHSILIVFHPIFDIVFENNPKIVIHWNFDFYIVTFYLCGTCVGLFHLLINVKRWNQTEYKRCCHSAIQVIKTSQLMSYINWLTISQCWWEIMPMALIYSYYNLSYKWNAIYQIRYILWQLHKTYLFYINY